MIKTVNTEAEYEALTKDTIESSAVFVRASNLAHIDGVNTVTRHPVFGDIVVLDEDHAARYIRRETFALDRLSSTWTTVGFVAGVKGRDVAVAYAEPTEYQSLAFISGLRWKLTGYTLDGTDRTGTLSLRSAANGNWATSVSYEISYNASSAEDFVSQLNAYFTANEPFTTQDWVAAVNDDGDVMLSCEFTNNNQIINDAASDGFEIELDVLSWLGYNTLGLKLNGSRYVTGVIWNMNRAMAYFRSDLSSASYNPSSDVTTVKLTNPVCLPAYLGTSSYQSDHCALLRETYGEGESGWEKFMRTFLPWWPQNYGVFGDIFRDALAITKSLAAEGGRPKQDGTSTPYSPMAVYAQSISFDCDGLRLGEWEVPSPETLQNALSGLAYPIKADGTIDNTDRTADTLNDAAARVGSGALRNNWSWWSCGRYSRYYGLFIYGGTGCWDGASFFGRFRLLPFAHLTLSDSED